MALRDVAYDTLERGEHAHSHGHGHSLTNGHHHHHTLDERPRKPVIHSLSGATDYDNDKRKTRILSPQAMGRAIAGRAYRVLRRGNLPFLIVFMV